MCAEIFWKRITAFSLTFMTGVFIGGSVISKPAPKVVLKETKPLAKDGDLKPNAFLEQKKCVPADENLKNQLLNGRELSVRNEKQSISKKRKTK